MGVLLDVEARNNDARLLKSWIADINQCLSQVDTDIQKIKDLKIARKGDTQEAAIILEINDQVTSIIAYMNTIINKHK
jgi:hypothetical protein